MGFGLFFRALLDEIDEFDNECFSGLPAEEYGVMLARALPASEASPIEGLAIEREKKRNCVRNYFKVLRYQIHAMRESRRIYRIERIWTSVEEAEDEIAKRTGEITKADEPPHTSTRKRRKKTRQTTPRINRVTMS